MGSPHFIKEFNTTATREAYSFDGNDIGGLVRDLEDGGIYLVNNSGAGVAVMTRIAGGGANGAAQRQGWIGLSLHNFREVDANGDVGAIAANGGLLASDTTPIMRGDAAETSEISWASSNSDIIATQLPVPPDFDGSQDCYVDITAASGGTTNACTFTVETGWDGAALVSDTATGAAVTTAATYTATIAAADVPDAPKRLTLILTPAAHTTDAMNLYAVALRYVKGS